VKIFTARCTYWKARYSRRKSSICSSVRPSVFAPRSPNIGDLVQRKHPKFGWNRGKSLFSAENLQYLWYDQGYCRWSIGSCICAFDWYRPWMTLNCHYALRLKMYEFSKPTTKIWMKTPPSYTALYSTLSLRVTRIFRMKRMVSWCRYENVKKVDERLCLTVKQC